MRFGRLLPLALLAAGTPLLAQRSIEQHSISDPDGALMGYYSALLIFAPDGAPSPANKWAVDLTGNLGYVPSLNYDQRTADRNKPEATNFTNVFGYLKATLWLPAHIGFSAAYTPPIDLNGATPHVYSVALEGLAATWGTVKLVPRATYTGGYIQGPITCNKNLSTSSDSSFVFYWDHICNSLESKDKIEPDQWTLELNATGSLAKGAILPFVGIGVVQYRTTFDIQVQTGTGIDTDHPILKMNATEGYGTLGTTWVVSPAWRFGGVLFWEPNMVFTGRLSATLRLNDR